MITIIAALADNMAIGRRGDLLWHLPEDLRHFKKLTLEGTVIMGRKTWESLPRRPLPKRVNIVISHDPDYKAQGAHVCTSLPEAIETANALRPQDSPGDAAIFIIGGGQLYALALPLADSLEITRIHAAADDADTFFPEIDPAEWEITAESSPCGESDAANTADYASGEDSSTPSFSFVTYRRTGTK